MKLDNMLETKKNTNMKASCKKKSHKIIAKDESLLILKSKIGIKYELFISNIKENVTMKHHIVSSALKVHGLK